MYYGDLRDYLDALDRRGHLRRIQRPVDKDRELHPLVRLQFRGLPPEERTGWLFERVTDGRGRTYPIPVAVGCLASSRAIYALGMGCAIEEIGERWDRALREPIPPIVVGRGACQEVVHQGAGLLEHGGLDELPIPISSPGLDNAPYITAGHVLTKDPVSGMRNLGNYRCMLKAPDRLGCLATPPRSGGARHWKRARELGQPLPVAIVVGATPNLAYTATARIAADTEEYAVAGAIAGAPLELVKCVSVDLEVPAHAEIVIEGMMPTDAWEREGAFGEFTGYMATAGPMMYVDVTAITHRRDLIYNAFVCQYPPSESAVMRSIGREAAIRKYLAHDNQLEGVLDVALPEKLGAYALLVVQVSRERGARPRDILHALVTSQVYLSKIVVVVDEDVDPRNLEQVWHAIGYRAQPPRDLFTVPMIPNPLDPSIAAPGQRGRGATGGATLIDATRKWPYSAVSLPRREYMEHALDVWRELDLPPLQLESPWFGYPLDGWTAEQTAEATLAMEGRYFETGVKLLETRQPPIPY